MEYIDILVTKDGYFCAAPPWTIEAGDLICLQNAMGEECIREVISVATDKVGGDFTNMVKNYIGYPLPRIKAKYRKTEVAWDEPVQE